MTQIFQPWLTKVLQSKDEELPPPNGELKGLKEKIDAAILENDNILGGIEDFSVKAVSKIPRIRTIEYITGCLEQAGYTTINKPSGDCFTDNYRFKHEGQILFLSITHDVIHERTYLIGVDAIRVR